MAQPREYSLFQLPGIMVASFQHVAAVIRLNDYRRAAAQPLADERCDMTKIHQRRNLYALMSGRKSEVINRVMGNGERVKIYLPDAKVFAGLNLLHPIAQCLVTFARLVVADVQ